jgi:hypothetical protein
MEKRDYILQELADLAPVLVTVSPANVYTVSPEYWQNMVNEVLEKVKMGAEAKFYFTKRTPYSLPEGYFSTLSELILQRAKQQEVKEESVFEEMAHISPLLNTISKKPVQSVPAGYFDTVQIPGIAVKPEAKVVSINRFSKVLNYAVAAVVCALLGIGGYLIATKEPAAIQANTEKTKTPLNKLSEQDIIEILSTGSTTEDFTSASLDVHSGSTIGKSIKEMSDDEIKQYLQETGDHEGI